MAVKVVKGNLLYSNCDIIGHQVNCKGVMGAGVAKQLVNMYPGLLSGYRKSLNSLPRPLGNVYMHQENGKLIANIFGQDSYGRYGLHTNYDALTDGLVKLHSFAKKHGYTIGLPYGIGCGLAGGDWKIVEKIINSIFGSSNVSCYLYKL